jgi:hypothetical protein
MILCLRGKQGRERLILSIEWQLQFTKRSLPKQAGLEKNGN